MSMALFIYLLALGIPSVEGKHPRWVAIAEGVMMPVVSNGFMSGAPHDRGPGTASHNRTIEALLTWFHAGGRGLDTAWKYRNQEAYGEAVRRSGLPRSGVFITTKIPCVGSAGLALDYVKQDVAKLGTTPDLVIIHGTGYNKPFVPGMPAYCWDDGSPTGRFTPCCKNMDELVATYHGLELALGQNLTRAIGTSSFQVNHLQAILEKAKVVPAVNQCEEFVGRSNHYSDATVDFCEKHGIRYMAFSPLGNMQIGKTVLKNPVAIKIGQAHNISAAQVGLAWIQQRGHVLVTATSSFQHSVEDMAIDGVTLSKDEMTQLDNVQMLDPFQVVV